MIGFKIPTNLMVCRNLISQRRGRTVLSRWQRELERRFNAAGPDRAPTDPCLKGAEQTDEDKDRCEQRCLRNETTTGEQENGGASTTGDTTFAVDVRFHLRSDAGSNSS